MLQADSDDMKEKSKIYLFISNIFIAIIIQRILSLIATQQ